MILRLATGNNVTGYGLGLGRNMQSDLLECASYLHKKPVKIIF